MAINKINYDSLYPTAKEEFASARDFAQAMVDMTELEGGLERKRRDLALRSDFNMCDTYKMFTRLVAGKKGVDCDDLFWTITENL